MFGCAPVRAIYHRSLTCRRLAGTMILTSKAHIIQDWLEVSKDKLPAQSIYFWSDGGIRSGSYFRVVVVGQQDGKSVLERSSSSRSMPDWAFGSVRSLSLMESRSLWSGQSKLFATMPRSSPAGGEVSPKSWASLNWKVFQISAKVQSQVSPGSRSG